MPDELILTFHGLGDPPRAIGTAERDVWLPMTWFAAIVDALPAVGIGLAFDDGNVSDLNHALGVLTARGRTARFFVLAGEIGAPGRLNAEQIAQLHAAGMTIGSHGLQHRDWRRLTSGELELELGLSRHRLAEIVDADVREAACPFGSYDRRVLAALRRAGYRRVYTSDGAGRSAESWLMPRMTVHRRRPLQHWLDLVADGSCSRPGPATRGKRLLKRWR